MKRITPVILSLALAATLAVPASALETDDLRRLLQEHYIDPVPDAVLALEDNEAILSALNDPYTVYLSPDSYNSFLTSVNGDTLVGIGVSIQTAYEDGYTILSVLDNSPALEAGLSAGDRLVAVDGVPLTAQSDVQSLITGKEGSQVTVTVIRAGTDTRMDFTMERRKVQIPIVTYKLMDDAGFIDCSSFGESTASTVEQAIAELDGQAELWVMDLRSNPGGVAQSAAATAGRFAGAAEMVHFRDAQGAVITIETTANCEDLTDKPLLILTSAHSASASELFSAAARDLGFGIILGERTYGKGIAQTVFDENNTPELFQGDALKMTTSRFFSPDGTTNHLIGVFPTLMLPADTALEAAQLLSATAPDKAEGNLRLTLGGFTLYLEGSLAREAQYQPVLAQILEALPPTAVVELGRGVGVWRCVTPEQAAQSLGLPFSSRYAFSDLADSAYPQEVAALAVYGLVSGMDDGAFAPNRSITRAEFAVMMAAALNLAPSEEQMFSDVPPTAWYADAVNAMAARGFLSGRGSGTFDPQSPISYEEMVTVLSAVSSWATMAGYDLSQRDLPAAQWMTYVELSPWAQAPAWRLEQLGISLELDQAHAWATRDQAAHLLYQLLSVSGYFWDET